MSSKHWFPVILQQIILMVDLSKIKRVILSSGFYSYYYWDNSKKGRQFPHFYLRDSLPLISFLGFSCFVLLVGVIDVLFQKICQKYQLVHIISLRKRVCEKKIYTIFQWVLHKCSLCGHIQGIIENGSGTAWQRKFSTTSKGYKALVLYIQKEKIFFKRLNYSNFSRHCHRYFC